MFKQWYLEYKVKKSSKSWQQAVGGSHRNTGRMLRPRGFRLSSPGIKSYLIHAHQQRSYMFLKSKSPVQGDDERKIYGYMTKLPHSGSLAGKLSNWVERKDMYRSDNSRCSSWRTRDNNLNHLLSKELVIVFLWRRVISLYEVIMFVSNEFILVFWIVVLAHLLLSMWESAIKAVVRCV